MKPYRLRDLALGDVNQALDYYDEIASDLADDFQSQMNSAIAHIQTHPGTGSPKYANTWAMRGSSDVLRYWLMNRFPYALFYIEHSKYIEIIRVLHQASDIPKHLQNNES
jgi:toxin ParE1/3/4